MYIYIYIYIQFCNKHICYGLNVVDLSNKHLCMNTTMMDVSRGYHGIMKNAICVPNCVSLSFPMQLFGYKYNLESPFHFTAIWL